MRAGAPTCDRFVTLAPHTPPVLSNELMMDCDNVLVASILEVRCGAVLQ